MPKLYELALEVQARRLRNTAVGSFVLGAAIAYELLVYHHHLWAALIALITVQTVIGSWIMRGDIKRDLREVERQRAK